ncbi:MAG: hypothetical protein H8F28_16475 [Fibrella sp.]|nr:hypothetical protein [Armatimonadota bacterium]
MYSMIGPLRRLTFLGLLGLCVWLTPSGCSDKQSVGASKDDSPQIATTTTAARGTMKAGARNRKTKTAIPQP